MSDRVKNGVVTVPAGAEAPMPAVASSRAASASVSSAASSSTLSHASSPPSTPAPSSPDASPSEEADRLQQEIEVIRGNLTGLVGELDRRRTEAFDWRLQLDRHKTALVVVAAGVAGLVTLAIVLGVRRHRAEQSLPSRARRVRRAVARFIDDPEGVSGHDPVARRVLAAGGSATAKALGQQLVRRLLTSGR